MFVQLAALSTKWEGAMDEQDERWKTVLFNSVIVAIITLVILHLIVEPRVS